MAASFFRPGYFSWWSSPWSVSSIFSVKWRSLRSSRSLCVREDAWENKGAGFGSMWIRFTTDGRFSILLRRFYEIIWNFQLQYLRGRSLSGWPPVGHPVNFIGSSWRKLQLLLAISSTVPTWTSSSTWTSLSCPFARWMINLISRLTRGGREGRTSSISGGLKCSAMALYWAVKSNLRIVNLRFKIPVVFLKNSERFGNIICSCEGLELRQRQILVHIASL